ncbi:VOC family protein [Streptomyces sp. NPDC048172]|uniref:VOC family protein n=1 Tax=Streptomyces sp. NPDC048172 TaxID=3365505 RepID=UPI0037125DF7
MREDLTFHGPAFDHLVHVVPDLDAAVAAYREAGLPASRAAAPAAPDLGFSNGSWRTDGTRYVELLRLNDESAYTTSTYAGQARHFAPDLRAAAAEGGAAVGVGVIVPDTAEAVARMRAMGTRVEHVVPTFPRGEGTISYDIGWPVDGPAWRPFVLTYPGTREERAALLDARKPERAHATVEALLVETPTPEEDARWTAGALALPEPVRKGEEWRVALPEGELRLFPGERARVTTVLLTPGPDGAPVPEASLLGLGYRASTRAA